ncbi:hypothetical protein Tco_1115659 [Tanacetum coccineum]
MNSLSRRYERLRQIPGELGIQSALPAPEQTSLKVSGRKRKHMELEPETRIPGLECNRALPVCTDKAKITRKRSKPDKHEHGNGRAGIKPGECYLWST